MNAKNDNGLTYFHRISAAAALIWTATVIGSASWNVYNEHEQTFALAKKEAVSNFNKDMAFRLWGTKHGGVYVPPTVQTPPNPYLSHIPDRDITLPSGKRLTLMNPAYMVRQLMSDFDELYGIKGRITSLKPLNPANAPDPWEREALTAFEHGAKEFFAITEHDGKKSLRLMRPMVAQAGCLKCHAHQGYKAGDVRGGVGVNVPMAQYQAMEKKAANAVLLSHLAIWLLGSAMLGLFFAKGRRFIMERAASHEALMRSEEALREQERFTQSLLRLSRRLETARNYAEVLNAARDEVRAIIGYQNLWAYLFTEDKQYAKALMAEGAMADAILSEEGAATLTIRGDRMLEEIAEAKNIVVVEDARTDERTDKKIVAKLGNRTIVNIPIFLMDKHMGSVGTGTFGDEGARMPTTSEQEYLCALASHMAVTLDRIHLLDERKRAEESLRMLNEELDMRIKERTTELEDKNAELERMNRMFVGRELRMIELKKKIAELENKTGRSGAGGLTT
ncbi:MAG: DUF3365 domain-containing protein [Nitrospirae bacterium]|nr:DUF3365 domain-containing protein [Nitrospirota bacterium]